MSTHFHARNRKAAKQKRLTAQQRDLAAYPAYYDRPFRRPRRKRRPLPEAIARRLRGGWRAREPREVCWKCSRSLKRAKNGL